MDAKTGEAIFAPHILWEDNHVDVTAAEAMATAKSPAARDGLHICEDCGANLALVGLRHRCVPHTVPHVPHTTFEQMPSSDRPNTTLHPKVKLKKGDAQRVAKWKAANKEKDRACHRELMRKRRAAGK